MDAVAKSGGVGASLKLTGRVVASPAKGQNIEVHVDTAIVLGEYVYTYLCIHMYLYVCICK
jgi:aspartyl/asparaginyl-tRNA synthetase